jgi:membrane-associated phospholipid phosphatase
LTGLDYTATKILSHRAPIGISLLISSYYYAAFEVFAIIILLKKNKRAAASLIISIIVLFLMQAAITQIAPRERPPEAMPIGQELMHLIKITGTSSSFFSGHSATAVAVYAIFTLIGYNPLLVLLLTVPILVSRITLVQHYISDVIGGVIIGYVVAKIVYLSLQRKKAAE